MLSRRQCSLAVLAASLLPGLAPFAAAQDAFPKKPINLVIGFPPGGAIDTIGRSLEAKFSVQYATARALLDGVVRLRHFEGAAHEEPEIRRLLQITQARAHPGMADDAEEQWGAEVIVTLRNGQRLSRRIDQLVGRGGKSAMTRDEMWEKFEDCGERSLPRDRLREVFDMLDQLEAVGDVNDLTRLLQPAAA